MDAPPLHAYAPSPLWLTLTMSPSIIIMHHHLLLATWLADNVPIHHHHAPPCFSEGWVRPLAPPDILPSQSKLFARCWSNTRTLG
ncbi:hypothetical protein BC829DRAFT_398897 [Chytridium lagenaria]|nr:hypothetical protein BC829DRAFT_398897 [Chytridium lagenaria]